jgi:uncharacterized protein
VSLSRLRVQVVYALADRHWLVEIALPEGATVADAIGVSGIEARVPAGEIDPARLGVFGRLVKPGTVLKDGDRVEIYRPLLCDPKDVRRRRAREQAEQCADSG